MPRELGESGAADFAAASTLSTRYVFPNRAETLPVLHAALRANPSDATAHFLSGSMYLSGGMVDEALREWNEARRLNRTIPVLHRNLGLVLLQLKNAPDQALEVFREGLANDRANLGLYAALSQTMTLLNRPASERVEALRQFPDLALMPPALVYDLALSLSEDGKAAEGEKLFENRFFARQEGGTNVRQIYLEVALLNALQLARAGRREEALSVAHNLGKERSGMAFTRDGLEPFLNDARTEFHLGEIESLARRYEFRTRTLAQCRRILRRVRNERGLCRARRPPSGRECHHRLEDAPGGDPRPLRQRPRQRLWPRRLRPRIDARGPRPQRRSRCRPALRVSPTRPRHSHHLARLALANYDQPSGSFWHSPRIGRSPATGLPLHSRALRPSSIAITRAASRTTSATWRSAPISPATARSPGSPRRPRSASGSAGSPRRSGQLVGGMPERTPLNARTVGSFERPSYRVEKVVYESQPNFHISGTLYIPTVGRPPFPGVLYQMGHTTNGKGDATYQLCCQTLAGLGYLVLGFDPMGQGERTYYPGRAPSRSRLGADEEHTFPGRQMLLKGITSTRLQTWDAVRSLDYLASHPLVDPKRLAVDGPIRRRHHHHAARRRSTTAWRRRWSPAASPKTSPAPTSIRPARPTMPNKI